MSVRDFSNETDFLLRVRVPYWEIFGVSCWRLCRSTLLFCKLIKRLWAAREVFFRPFQLFMGCDGRRWLSVYKTRSHIYPLELDGTLEIAIQKDRS